MICRVCGICCESLDSDDVCRDCGGKDENEEGDDPVVEPAHLIYDDETLADMQAFADLWRTATPQEKQEIRTMIAQRREKVSVASIMAAHPMVTVDFKGDNLDWIKRLYALGAFLREYRTRSEERVTVFAYEDEDIGGLRIAEISFTINHGSEGMVGASYMRCDAHGRAVLACCEDFLATHGIKPTRPEGWESYLNEHGEARVSLLRSMRLHKAAAADYQKQIQEEQALEAAAKTQE